MNLKNILKTFLFFASIALFTACGSDEKTTLENDNAPVISKRAGINEVIIQLNSNPDRLNIVTATSGVASEVQAYIFEGFLGRDNETLEFLPYLVKGRATMEKIKIDVFGKEQDGLKYSYEIREEAKWNDGSPITGYDAAFYLKCIKNPKVDCEDARPSVEAIIDIVIDKQNPKKVSVFFKDTYFKSELISGLIVLQENKYDPDGLMKNFTIRELSNPANEANLMANTDINKFATLFNGEKYSRDFIEGSGPYVFKSWVTGERIVLEKNQNWWGKNLVGKEKGFTNYPDKLIFEIIVDATTAVTAQKDEGLDLMKHTARDYNDLKDNKGFLKLFKFTLPISPSYSYIGLNTKSPKLSDKRVRQALSMAVDYETLKRVYLYGMAERTVSPILPVKSYYNNSITPYPFDLNKAAALLEEAGWVDEDGDGIREKEIEGDDIDLSLEFKYSQGSDFAKNMALVLKKNFKQIGIKLVISQKEWTVFLDEIKAHDFDMMTLAWVMGPSLDDMKQIWHTDSYNGGSNTVGFGNEHTDKLIDDIRYELDEEKRNKMYMEIQEIIHEEAPYIFLFTRKNKIAIHKRFDNAKGYLVRPGYVASEFKLNPYFGVAKATAK